MTMGQMVKALPNSHPWALSGGIDVDRAQMFHVSPAPWMFQSLLSTEDKTLWLVRIGCPTWMDADFGTAYSITEKNIKCRATCGWDWLFLDQSPFFSCWVHHRAGDISVFCSLVVHFWLHLGLNIGDSLTHWWSLLSLFFQLFVMIFPTVTAPRDGAFSWAIHPRFVFRLRSQEDRSLLIEALDTNQVLPRPGALGWGLGSRYVLWVHKKSRRAVLTFWISAKRNGESIHLWWAISTRFFTSWSELIGAIFGRKRGSIV